MKSQILGNEEYPPYLCVNGIEKSEFNGLPQVNLDHLSAEAKNQLFAMGGNRANVQIGYVMFNVLFLREHNRIASLLADEYPTWDDERLFQTARNILLVMLIRIVIEEYINHIAPFHFRFFLDGTAFPNERWYRQNWMAAEFTLVYRWHMLIPTELIVDGKPVNTRDTMWNTSTITSRGLGASFDDASRQPAGKVGLFNTPEFLKNIDAGSVLMGRQLQLASYNDYRFNYQFPRASDFNEVSSNPEVQDSLRRLYGKVDRIDYYVGIFAEDTVPNSVLPPSPTRLLTPCSGMLSPSKSLTCVLPLFLARANAFCARPGPWRPLRTKGWCTATLNRPT